MTIQGKENVWFKTMGLGMPQIHKNTRVTKRIKMNRQRIPSFEFPYIKCPKPGIIRDIRRGKEISHEKYRAASAFFFLTSLGSVEPSAAAKAFQHWTHCVPITRDRVHWEQISFPHLSQFRMRDSLRDARWSPPSKTKRRPSAISPYSKGIPPQNTPQSPCAI